MLYEYNINTNIAKLNNVNIRANNYYIKGCVLHVRFKMVVGTLL